VEDFFMSDEPDESTDERDFVTPADRRNVRLWAVLLIVLFIVVGIFTVWAVHKNKTAATNRHEDRMNPNVGEGGTQPPPTALPEGANPVRVHAGIYVDRVVELSVKDAGWTVDFYIWGRWKGEAVDPGENFQVVDGWIDSKEKLDEYTNGDEHYVLYRVVARITKFFDVSRFPCDDHLLTINIESPAYERDKFLFVADTENSGISSRIQIAGYSIYRQAILEKPHAYKSTRGDPRLTVGTDRTHSQLRMGIWISRPGWGLYLKMFIALFGAVGVAFLVFFIKPMDVDPRFGLGVGALFAVIANTYVTSSLVPDIGTMTLADMVNDVGIGLISLTILQSTISLYLYESKGKKALSSMFDKVSFLVLFAGYLVINLALPLAAAL
jgi:hypothetical protein